MKRRMAKMPLSKDIRVDNRGFTLLEVLIAVAILSLALIALVRTVGLGARAQSQLRDLTLAMWVAQNVVSEIRLTEPQPALGQRSGRMRMGQQEWRWQAEINNSPEPSLKRIEVKVFEYNDMAAPRASLTGFSNPP